MATETEKASALDSLSKADKAAVEKTKNAIRRRNHGDKSVHPAGAEVEFYAVILDGKLLGFIEHDPNSGQPHQTLRQRAGGFGLLDDDGDFMRKPDLEKVEVVTEG